jgi:hypothetical protein
MPFRSMIYALSYASLKTPRRESQRLRESYQSLGNNLAVLNSYATRICGLSEPDPYSMTDTLRSACDSYIGLFYHMVTSERAAYLKTLSSGKHRVKAENNLLFVPAIMSEAGEDPELLKWHIFKHLYSMPFRALYDSSKAGLRLTLLENGMAIKSVNHEVVHDFSKSVARLDAKIAEIKDGKISPIKDEELKTEFINSAVKMSEETDINIAEIISAKVRTERHALLEAQRLMRRAIHRNA